MRDDTRKQVSEVFRVYNEILRKSAALDFDDLLLRAVQMLRDHADVRAAWSARFQYLMVDEFQDTNAAQEELVRLLAGTRKNVCVVGDEDQSIYGWRGARAGNLKRFTEDFPSAKMIRLEENYRSTQTIWMPRRQWSRTIRTASEKFQATLGVRGLLRFFEAPDSDGGGRIHLRRDFVRSCATIRCSSGGSLSHGGAIAIIRRSAAPDWDPLPGGGRIQLLRTRRGAERAGLRAADFSSRGRHCVAASAECSPARHRRYDGRSTGSTRARNGQIAMGRDSRRRSLAGKKSAGALNYFRKLIEALAGRMRRIAARATDRARAGKTGYLDWVEQQDNIEHTSRAENLRELSNAMAEATEQGQTLEELLDHAALERFGCVRRNDSRFANDASQRKGPGIRCRVSGGARRRMFPHSRSVNTNAEIEEERRLFYVGMTRAKKSLVISRAIYRRSYGEDRMRASTAVALPRGNSGELIEAAAGSHSEPGQTRRYEADPGIFGRLHISPRYSHAVRVGRSAAAARPYGGAARSAEGAFARSQKDPLIGAHECGIRNMVWARLSKWKAKAKNGS